MIVACDKCNCPHERFSVSPDVKRLQDEGKLRHDSGPEGVPH